MKPLLDAFDTPRIDCSSINISYAATGLVTLTFKVYVKKDKGLPYTKENTPKFSLCISKERRFNGLVTSQQASASIEFNNVVEWSVSAFGFVCSDSNCGARC